MSNRNCPRCNRICYGYSDECIGAQCGKEPCKECQRHPAVEVAAIEPQPDGTFRLLLSDGSALIGVEFTGTKLVYAHNDIVIRDIPFQAKVVPPEPKPEPPPEPELTSLQKAIAAHLHCPHVSKNQFPKVCPCKEHCPCRAYDCAEQKAIVPLEPEPSFEPVCSIGGKKRDTDRAGVRFDHCDMCLKPLTKCTCAGGR